MAFYSGGFIYNPKTNSVLLHLRDEKTENNPSALAFFGGLSKKNETPQKTFMRELSEELDLKVDENAVITLCDYFNPDFNTHRYVFYLKIEELPRINLKEGKDVSWFNLDRVLVQNLSKRTRQDL